MDAVTKKSAFNKTGRARDFSTFEQTRGNH